MRVKVWPLRAGGAGFDACGGPVVLNPGRAAWLDDADAHARAADGEVQIMVGLDTASLAPAVDAPAGEGARRRGYRRSDVQPERG